MGGSDGGGHAGGAPGSGRCRVACHGAEARRRYARRRVPFRSHLWRERGEMARRGEGREACEVKDGERNASYGWVQSGGVGETKCKVTESSID